MRTYRAARRSDVKTAGPSSRMALALVIARSVSKPSGDVVVEPADRRAADSGVESGGDCRSGARLAGLPGAQLLSLAAQARRPAFVQGAVEQTLPLVCGP